MKIRVSVYTYDPYRGKDIQHLEFTDADLLELAKQYFEKNASDTTVLSLDVDGVDL